MPSDLLKLFSINQQLWFIINIFYAMTNIQKDMNIKNNKKNIYTFNPIKNHCLILVMDVNVRDLNLTMESLTLTLTFLRFPKKNCETYYIEK